MKYGMYVGGTDPVTVKTTAEAIIAICKAAVTEPAIVASVNALAAIAHAPTNVSVSGCSIGDAMPQKKRKR